MLGLEAACGPPSARHICPHHTQYWSAYRRPCAGTIWYNPTIRYRNRHSPSARSAPPVASMRPSPRSRSTRSSHISRVKEAKHLQQEAKLVTFSGVQSVARIY